MSIDPFTATAIGATAKWMWDSYGKTFVDGWAKNIGGSREKKQLEKQWQDATQTYLEKLYDQVNWLRLLGKRDGVLLEKIYTDLNLLDQPTAEKWYDRAMLEEDFRQRRSFHDHRRGERQDGLKVAQIYKRLYILGKPGAGKTTFMKFIALEVLRGKLGNKIPFFITLKEIADRELAIVPFIVEKLRQSGDWNEGDIDLHLSKFIIRLLKVGQAVVLFDGLDEVSEVSGKRTRLINDIKNFVNEFENCQMLITCRVAASDYSFARFKYVEMADFTDEQQEQFVSKWFQNDWKRREACWRALKESRVGNLQELACIPLLLTLLCITFERRGEFPPDRDEVYRISVNALLFEWDSSRLIKRDELYEGLDVKYRERLLAWVAYETFSRGEYLLDEAKLATIIEEYLRFVPKVQGIADGLNVLKTIEAQHGLLVERAHGIYSFSHLTIQEYFTARYIVENIALNTLPRLFSHMVEDAWREVFLLTAGMLFDATDFIEQFLAALDILSSQSDSLKAQLGWAIEKSSHLYPNLKPSVARAFSNLLYLDYDLSRSLALSIVVALDSNFGAALNRSYDSISWPSLDSFDLVGFEKTETAPTIYARVHDRILDIILDISVRYDLAFLENRPNGFELEDIFNYLQKNLPLNAPDWIKKEVKGLTLPTKNQSEKELGQFQNNIDAILLRCWEMDKFWEPTEADAILTAQYFKAVLLLINCLNVSTVDREAIKTRLLMAPK